MKVCLALVKYARSVFVMVGFAGLVACGRSQEPRLIVAVAANFRPAMVALEADFEARSGEDILVVYGSTGKLYAQIEQGAPFDLFLSADADRPMRLAEGGRTAGAPWTYAIGRLVMWSPGASDTLSPDQLRLGGDGKISIANPDLAPYGAAAMETLRALDLDEVPLDRLVLGENVGQAFAFVATRNAEFGFVSWSLVLQRPEEARGAVWMVPSDLHAPIRQQAVILAGAATEPAAFAFAAYLQGDAAGTIIERHGYGRP